MKKITGFLTVTTLGWLLTSANVFGEGCGSDACQTPGVGSALSATITTINVASSNSSTAIANEKNAAYWFIASKGAFTTTPDLAGGTVVLAEVDNQNSNPQQPGQSINTVIEPTLGGTTYNIWVVACAPGAAANDASCSSPVSLGSIKTSDYPPQPGFEDIVPADTAPRQFTARTQNVQDSTFVTGWHITVTNLDGDLGGSSADISGPLTAARTVTSADYANLLPNREYRNTNFLVYHYNQAGPSSNTAPFFTQPNPPQTPAAIVTHGRFSVTVNYTAATLNHNGTQYKVQIHQGSGLGGAIVASSPLLALNAGQASGNIKVPGLTPDPVNPLTFTAGVIAVNEGGSSWLNSDELQIGTFIVQPFQVSFTFSGISTTGATATMTLNDGSQVDHFHTLLDGSDLGATAWTGGSGAPASQVLTPFSSLTPNTSHSVQAKICESPSGDDTECSGFLPVSAATFYTLPAAPVSPALNSSVSGQTVTLGGTWTDALNAASTYEYNYGICPVKTTVDQTTTAKSFSTTTSILPNTSYCGQVRTLSNDPGNTTTNASAYVAFTQTTTPNTNPVVTLNPINLYVSSITLHANATGNGTLSYQWTQTAGPAGTFRAGTATTADAIFDFPTSGVSYTLQLVVSDTFGGSTTVTHTFTPGASATAMTITPTNQIVGRGQVQTFSATIYDQSTPPNVIPGATATWSIPGAAGSLSASPAASVTFTASNTVGDYTLSAVATVGSASQSTTVHVRANTVVVSPTSPANVGTGGTPIQFTAVVTEPANNSTITPGIAWSVASCDARNTIDPVTGIFTPVFADVTPCVITARTPFGDTGTTTITVDNSVPSITVQPTATLFVTSGTLSVLATGFHTEANLHYTWSLVSPVGAQVEFADTDSNSAKNTTVTLHQIGTYVFKVTVRDTVPAGNTASTSANTSPVVLSAVLTSITVSPDGVTIQALNDQVFTATGLDQFKKSTSAGNVTWTTSGGGNISGAGVFSSPSLGQNITVRARNGNVVGAATVNVISYDVSGAYAYPVPFKSTRDRAITFTGLGSSSKIRIYTATGRKVFSIEGVGPVYPWDVKNTSGDNVASGVYFYVIESPEGKKDGKLIIIQ